jgi:calcineurin-like phosphoesterase family protein
MNDAIKARHNARVKDGDTVYHLGDTKMTSVGPNMREILRGLNGYHVLLQGNHDKRNGVNTSLKHCVIETFGLTILLIHDPKEAEMIMAGGGIDLAFVGHVHKLWKFKENMINVGVDVWDYYPVDAKQILKAHKNWKKEVCDGISRISKDTEVK